MVKMKLEETKGSKIVDTSGKSAISPSYTFRIDDDAIVDLSGRVLSPIRKGIDNMAKSIGTLGDAVYRGLNDNRKKRSYGLYAIAAAILLGCGWLGFTNLKKPSNIEKTVETEQTYYNCNNPTMIVGPSNSYNSVTNTKEAEKYNEELKGAKNGVDF